MVEFGLKLEDNKVAEWSDKYIDYEKLKSLLKKAKASAEKLSSAEDACDPATVLEARSSYARVAAAELEGRSSSQRLSSMSRSSSKNSLTLPRTLSRVSLHSLEHVDGDSPRKAEESAIATEEAVRAQQEGGGGDEENGLMGEVQSSAERRGRSEETVPLVTSASDGQYGTTSKDVDGFQDEGDEITGKEMSGRVAKLKNVVAGYFQQKDDADESSKQQSRLEGLMRATDGRIFDFSTALYHEIEKVNDFYKKKLTDITNQLDFLVESAEGMELGNSYKRNLKNHNLRQSILQITGLVELQTVKRKSSEQQKRPETKEDIQLKREEESLRRALREYYRTVKLLENYAIMNYTGFFKIIKKFNKNFPSNKGKFKAAFEKIVCCEGQEAEALGDRMEMLFAKWFCGGNVLDARVQILPKKGDTLEMDWTHFRLGFHLGLCAILALWICWDCIWGLVSDGNSTIGARTAFPVFRACGGLLLIHWFWGFSVFMWSRYRVNYIFLFDFDPRTVRTSIMIFDDASIETLIYLVLMLLYYKAGANDLPEVLTVQPGIFPFILVLYTLKKLLFPWRTRLPLWRSIRDVVSTPLTSPVFFHSYVADWFTSMVKIFQDMLWTACFVFSGDFLLSEDAGDSRKAWEHQLWYKNIVIPLICLAPLWFRFNQSLRRYIDTGKRWPNLANAFKYALSQTVTLFGAFHPLYLYYQDNPSKEDSGKGADLFQVLWVGLFVTSSLYSYFWDVYMDWGLGRPKYKFLGPRLMYPSRIAYYGVIFADLFLRFMWVMTLVPPQSGAKFVLPSYLTAITMSLELLRRTLWGLFRLENEHRHSTDKYRKVDFVPLHFSTGHDHKYKQKDSVGWSVLGEVTLVNIGVIVVMVISVVAAQRAAHTS